MTLRHLHLVFPILLVAGVFSANANATVGILWNPSIRSSERLLWKSAVHGSEFNAVPHVAARPSCEATRAPEALTTPDPLMLPSSAELKVTVSFIIGTDGRIHSPLILESVDSEQDTTVLKTVSSWRYRPATCNGVPTETEGKIEFLSR